MMPCLARARSNLFVLDVGPFGLTDLAEKRLRQVVVNCC